MVQEYVSPVRVHKYPFEMVMAYYNEYKSKLLKKIKAEKGEIGATGGGPAKKISLTALQERLYTILGRDIGEPLPGVRHNPLSQVEDAFQRPSTNCSIIPDENNSYIIEVPQENEHCVFRPESYLVLDPEDYTGQQLVAMNCTGQQSDLADHMGQHTAETVEHTGQPPVRESLPTEPRRRRRRRRTSPQPATQQDHSMQEASERLEAMEQISAEATREHAKATREQAEATRMLAASIRFAGERLREAITFATQSPPRTRAYERRFPSCPQIPVVVECLITDDSWSADDSQRHTTRRCQLNVDAPYLLKKMIGVDFVYFIQKNHLDLKNRVLVIEATNETFASRVCVVEKCRYYVHPENSEWTCFEQSALLDVINFFGLENTVEKLSMKQYASNIAKGKELIDSFMAGVHADGVMELSPWSDTDAAYNRYLRKVVSRGTEPLSPKDFPESRPHAQPDQYTLDSEYIRRYLGELTPMQESRLLQLRKWIADLQKGKVPSDTTLLRFLRARDFNVEKAREMLSQSLLWRKKHQVDRLLAEYETPDVVSQYFPGGWHHHDKDGRPLYVLRLGQMDVKGLLKSIGEDGLLKLTLHVCEEGLKLQEEATRAADAPVATWCLLVDLDGLNMRHLWRPGVRALLRIIQIVEANYPETMGRVLIVRAPRVFPILWTIVSTFIDENTRSKFLFYGGKDYLQPGGLLDYIPKDLIPDFLGGPCKSFVHEGGLVPKSLYVSGAFTEREGDPLCEDSIYRSVSLGKGQVHEVIVANKDPGSVLTWDFDVLRHDIGFSVLRSERELRHAPPDASNGCGEEGSVVQKGWREGEHYHRVEPTLVCHDGESIQGSHVMVSAGSYVLQWRCEVLESTPRAAQLMYFHETLASHQYKGSMSSLQSGTSGFSCLSGVSSCPSR